MKYFILASFITMDLKYYILASLVIFTMVIGHNLRKSQRVREKQELSFWERERLSNQVRRKPLDDLNYIKIPLENLPMQLLNEDEKVADIQRIMNELSTEPIVNLTGYTNTDLKLEYGTANITYLMKYDQNYTVLANALQQWANILYQKGYLEETRQILEFAVNTHTDVSHSYILLADIYEKQGHPELIPHLTETAETLNSLNKEVILRRLSERRS